MTTAWAPARGPRPSEPLPRAAPSRAPPPPRPPGSWPRPEPGCGGARAAPGARSAAGRERRAARAVCFHAALSREDGFRHCALRKPQMAPAPARPPCQAPGQPGRGSLRRPRPPQPGVGRPAGILLQEPRWRLQRKPRGRPLARRHPPQCVNRRFKPERRNARARGREGGPRQQWPWPGGVRPALEIWRIKAALRLLWQLRRRTGARGRGPARPPQAVIDRASQGAPKFVYSRIA